LLNIYLVRNFMLVPSRDGTIMSNKHENGTNAFLFSSTWLTVV
jgi:hypothetical protein